jgi:hypothetical protein
MRWIIVTGLPATGKTTLAQLLASRYDLPLLAKDAFLDLPGARLLCGSATPGALAPEQVLALTGHWWNESPPPIA